MNQGDIKWFKKQQACLWTAEEIDTTHTLTNFNKKILACFASADSIVMDNLIEQFGAEVNTSVIKLNGNMIMRFL